MSKAIKITLTKAEGEHDLAASKLFGAPVLPEGWQDEMSDEVIFFGQIRLSDIAPFDPENRLPHTGYLYLFLDTEIYPYTAMIEYHDCEPRLVIDNFNELEERFAHLNKDFLMTFEEADEDYDGTKLFGVPSSEPADLDDYELLLQFDPLDNETGFLSEIDGYAYFFFGKGTEDRMANPIFHAGARFEIDRS